METREQILCTGLQLLGTVGARQCSARAVENAAGLPHGSVRHHFGTQAGLLEALVDYLLEHDSPRPNEDLNSLISRWLTQDRVRTQARYELTLAALRAPVLREKMAGARDSHVAFLRAAGHQPAAARATVAMLDGLVLSALLYERATVDLTYLPAQLNDI